MLSLLALLAISQPTLVGFVRVPPEAMAERTVGRAVEGPVNGVEFPLGVLPFQGVSCLARGDGSAGFLALVDNGFGTKANSGDWPLHVVPITLDFIQNQATLGKPIFLTDPRRKSHAGSRELTGADFDPESLRVAADGTWWIGEEFGPALLHFDRRGRMMNAPFPAPGVFSPDSPRLGEQTSNLPRSGGFEGLAISPNGKTLYALLERTVECDPPGALRLLEFSTTSQSWTGRRWFYRLDDPAHAIGEITALSDSHFLVVERDGGQGDEARFKKVFLVERADSELRKTELVDLLDLADPRDLDGDGATTFRFPFHTIESVLPLDAHNVLVCNDTNYPFSTGRRQGEPEATEFILIRLEHPLPIDPRLESWP